MYSVYMHIYGYSCICAQKKKKKDHICLRVEVPVCEISAQNPGYKHTSTHTKVQVKAGLANFLQLEMQFLFS